MKFEFIVPDLGSQVTEFFSQGKRLFSSGGKGRGMKRKSLFCSISVSVFVSSTIFSCLLFPLHLRGSGLLFPNHYWKISMYFTENIRHVFWKDIVETLGQF